MASLLMLYLLVIFAIYSGNLIAGMAGNRVNLKDFDDVIRSDFFFFMA